MTLGQLRAEPAFASSDWLYGIIEAKAGVRAGSIGSAASLLNRNRADRRPVAAGDAKRKSDEINGFGA